MGYATASRIFGVLALGLMAACQTGQTPLSSNAGDGVLDAAPSLSGGDVEAPDVFQVTDTALWDGRPSLGGVWVASLDEPERVIMRNSANGKFVIGALFKRERDNPGPSLQISSDAAAALGMLAGQPVSISVTALRRQETPAPETAPEAPAESVTEAPTKAPPKAPSAAAPQDEVKVQTLPAPKDGAASAPAAAKAPTAPPDPAPAAGAGGYIQIGFFSVEANAQRAVTTLAAAGITATIRRETSNGKTFWSVGARGDAAVLARVKSAGFSDAYLTKG